MPAERPTPSRPHPSPQGASAVEQLTDHELAAAAGSGDSGALETLLTRHADRINAICRRVTGNPHDGMDATQEAMIAIVRGIGRYDGRAAFTTWLYRVATNAALDEVRRRSRRPQLTDDGVVPERFQNDAFTSIESQVGARIDVDAALATLPPDFRAAVVLRDLCDLDYAEIAEVLGVPVGTVRSRIARGRSALGQQLGNRMPGSQHPTQQTP